MASASNAAPDQVAAALRVSIGLLLRRLRQLPIEDELSLPETSALSRLDRGGPATAAALAKRERISPQSMGATLAGLQRRGLVQRDPDPTDGRRIVISLTADGHVALHDRRSRRVAAMAQALADGFTATELEQLTAAAPLLERLAQTI